MPLEVRESQVHAGAQIAQTLDRGLQVLEAVARSADPVSVSEAATAVGLDRRVTHRLISTLAARGYLQRDGAKGYRLGPTCLSLASAISDLRALAHPYLQELAQQSGETTHLVVLSGREVVFIDGIESRKALRVGNRTGRLLPATATSVGKAWLAAMPPSQVQRFYADSRLPSVTDRTIVDPDALFAELERIRQRGYATSRGESEDGVGSVGMAVRAPDGQPRLAMSVAMPLARFTEDTELAAVTALRKVANDLSEKLSQIGP